MNKFILGLFIGGVLAISVFHFAYFKNEKLVPVKVLTVSENSTILETVDEHYRFEIVGNMWGNVGDEFKVKESEID